MYVPRSIQACVVFPVELRQHEGELCNSRHRLRKACLFMFHAWLQSPMGVVNIPRRIHVVCVSHPSISSCKIASQFCVVGGGIVEHLPLCRIRLRDTHSHSVADQTLAINSVTEGARRLYYARRHTSPPPHVFWGVRRYVLTRC